MRLRDLGITIGDGVPGKLNSITDVTGVRVGLTTLIEGEGAQAIRTGVTAVMPHDSILDQHLFAGFYSFNGCGELTGTAWIAESGMLTTPIVLTNTHSVGAAHEGIIRYTNLHTSTETFMLPVVGETCDAFLNDINGLHVRPEHVIAALEAASAGPVAEGNVGGGTGMICHEFKGGTGTASRQTSSAGASWTVGALVQANYGVRTLLRVDGVRVGRAIGTDRVPGVPWRAQPAGSSIIVLLATDAPLLPIQCQRLARRATLGLARVGGTGHNGSGDLFLAWSTANRLPPQEGKNGSGALQVQMLGHEDLDPLFDAAAEAVEEAILNALVAATTIVGRNGHTIYALPHDLLLESMGKS